MVVGRLVCLVFYIGKVTFQVDVKLREGIFFLQGKHIKHFNCCYSERGSIPTDKPVLHPKRPFGMVIFSVVKGIRGEDPFLWKIRTYNKQPTGVFKSHRIHSIYGMFTYIYPKKKLHPRTARLVGLPMCLEKKRERSDSGQRYWKQKHGQTVWDV